MTDSIIVDVMIFALVFIAGVWVGGVAMTSRVMRHARNLYAPHRAIRGEATSDADYRRCVIEVAKTN